MKHTIYIVHEVYVDYRNGNTSMDKVIALTINKDDALLAQHVFLQDYATNHLISEIPADVGIQIAKDPFIKDSLMLIRLPKISINDYRYYGKIIWNYTWSHKLIPLPCYIEVGELDGVLMNDDEALPKLDETRKIELSP